MGRTWLIQLGQAPKRLCWSKTSNQVDYKWTRWHEVRSYCRLTYKGAWEFWTLGRSKTLIPLFGPVGNPFRSLSISGSLPFFPIRYDSYASSAVYSGHKVDTRGLELNELSLCKLLRFKRKLVAGGRIELPTLGLWIPRSNHLSYPATFGLFIIKFNSKRSTRGAGISNSKP